MRISPYTTAKCFDEYICTCAGHVQFTTLFKSGTTFITLHTVINIQIIVDLKVLFTYYYCFSPALPSV